MPRSERQKRYNVHDYYAPLSSYERRLQAGRELRELHRRNEQLVEQLLKMTSEQRRRWIDERWLEFLRTGI